MTWRVWSIIYVCGERCLSIKTVMSNFQRRKIAGNLWLKMYQWGMWIKWKNQENEWIKEVKFTDQIDECDGERENEYCCA